MNHRLTRAQPMRRRLFGTALIFVLTAVSNLPAQVTGKVYWTWSGRQSQGEPEFGTVQRANLDGSNPEVISVTQPTRLAFAISLSRDELYFCRLIDAISGYSLRRADLELDTESSVFFGEVNAVAIDEVGGMLYAGVGDRILRGAFDWNQVQTVIGGLVAVRGLTLDLPAGKLYWTEGESAATGFIRQASLDGSVPITIATAGANVGPIRLDLESRRMYWRNSGGIRRAGMNGTNLVSIVNETVESFDFDRRGGKIYWTTLSAVRRANLDGTEVETLLTESTAIPGSKAIAVIPAAANLPQACCFPGSGCIDLPEAKCRQSGGFSQPIGTSCNSIICPFGGCCLPHGSCAEPLSAQACIAQDGVYQGDGTSCGDQPCPVPLGACCLPNGACTRRTQAECGVVPNSRWAGPGTICEETPQGLICPTGVCCLPSGLCQVTPSGSACLAMGGRWLGTLASCAGANCPPPVGACCLDDGNCIVVTEQQCVQELQDRWAGPQTACRQSGGRSVCPFGACCLPDGTCGPDRSPDQCAQEGGEYQGPSTQCLSISCPQPQGACCLADGGCLGLTESDCRIISMSRWLGPTVMCEQSPTGPTCPIGACCLPDTRCFGEWLQEQCAAEGGVFQGVKSECASILCPPPTGACCLESGSCLVLESAACEQFSGSVWAGPTTSCVLIDGSPTCPAGACCLGEGGCIVLRVPDCLAAVGARWVGQLTTCEDRNSNQTADVCEIIPGDMNGDGRITRDDLRAFILTLLGRPETAEQPQQADLNNDGRANGRDIALFVARLIQ